MPCTNSKDFFPLSAPSAAKRWQQVKNKPRQISGRRYNVIPLPDLWLLEVVRLSLQHSFLFHHTAIPIHVHFGLKQRSLPLFAG